MLPNILDKFNWTGEGDTKVPIPKTRLGLKDIVLEEGANENEGKFGIWTYYRLILSPRALGYRYGNK